MKSGQIAALQITMFHAIPWEWSGLRPLFDRIDPVFEYRLRWQQPYVMEENFHSSTACCLCPQPDVTSLIDAVQMLGYPE